MDRERLALPSPCVTALERDMGIEQEALPCARVRGGAAGPWAGLGSGLRLA